MQHTRVGCQQHSRFWHTGLKTAEAAKAVAVLRAETILKMPLWQHALKMLATMAALLWAASLLSKLLHREADRVEAGDVSSPSSPSKQISSNNNAYLLCHRQKNIVSRL